MKPIMTICETKDTYCAKVNGITVTITKDTIAFINGIQQHPRMLAINGAAEQAKITEWILFNV